MRLTSRGHLGILALVELAREETHELSTIELAKRTGGSARFLETAMRELHIAGLVRSRKGRHGGYRLAHPPHEITVGRISRVLDGPPSPSPCGELNASAACNWCPGSPCLLTDLLQNVTSAVESVLGAQTLAELAGRPDTSAHQLNRHALEQRSPLAPQISRAV